MELHPPAGVKAEPDARCAAYLQRLPVDPARREALRQAALQANAEEGMAALHQALAAEDGSPGRGLDTPALVSQSARLTLACDGSCVEGLMERGRLRTAPTFHRCSMAPGVWPPRLRLWPFSLLIPRRGPRAPPLRQGRLARTWRRTTLTGLTVAQTVGATWGMLAVLPYHGSQPLELALLVLFALLFFWLSAGFWTAVLGFVLLLKGGDAHSVSSRNLPPEPIAADARTAVVMPICNEDVARVCAGLAATYESVARTGALERFDFFLLSDSSDPDLRAAETAAWLDLCRKLGACGRIFYRWRRSRIKRKSGNIADFCRRWGGDYRYMVVLDADSVMTGTCLTTLVRLMEARPDAGIVQTAPRAAGRDTLHARIQQFASRVYGPLFAAGLHFWELGEAHYWGHNAIIRLEPFIRHCALGRLPRRGGGEVEILSHDFVEAALMRRAGWSVWIAYDLPGSYEETPPNLLDELGRDRRWCQGNLINFRLLLAEGLHPAHRVVFATGVMAYLSAPLWFGFLLLSTLLLAIHTLVPPQYFVRPYQLFPLWPEWHRGWALALSATTALLLFAPKLLALLLLLRQGARDFGGGLRLALSMVGEALYSMLLAPIRMLFHTQFVVAGLAGWHGGWTSPTREDAQTPWREALRRHGLHTLLGIAWAGLVYRLNPAFLGWLTPVVGALILSVPLSVWSSRAGLGRRLRARRLFLIPEEIRPLPELERLSQSPQEKATDFIAAVVDPLANAVACAMARVRRCSVAEDHRRALIEKTLNQGPQALEPKHRLQLLDDALALAELHYRLWSAPAPHPAWAAATTALTPSSPDPSRT